MCAPWLAGDQSRMYPAYCPKAAGRKDNIWGIISPWSPAGRLWWRRRSHPDQNRPLWRLHRLWRKQQEVNKMSEHLKLGMKIATCWTLHRIGRDGVFLLGALSAYVRTDNTAAPCSLQGSRWLRCVATTTHTHTHNTKTSHKCCKATHCKMEANLSEKQLFTQVLLLLLLHYHYWHQTVDSHIIPS